VTRSPAGKLRALGQIMSEVATVIASYEPDLGVLAQTLGVLAQSTACAVVYDNSESEGTPQRVRALCEEVGARFLGGTGNVGIAAAQNRAVQSIGPDAAECVVFLDQDSAISEGFIERLHASYRALRALDPRAGILGALPVDDQSRPYRVKVLDALGQYRRAHFVISSGSIMSLADLRAAGGFREDLFIDLVDNDISWRMQRRGQACYIDTDLPFQHRVGTGKSVRAFGRTAPVSAPFRHYYQTRNPILLARTGDLSWAAVARGIAKRFGAVILSAARYGDGRQRLGFMCKGICDGIRGRGGRLA